jgi:hypothetical protein
MDLSNFRANSRGIDLPFRHSIAGPEDRCCSGTIFPSRRFIAVQQVPKVCVSNNEVP